ncbi:ABC transporter permease [Bifidobacterium gallicum]|uniref:Efflux ABC transporter, permease protein n=1 Tax=Bifidobacterium gallicum DSM 20093 = LMG 11596 TaxID=561180 RepID=D1NS04_9BIFI|nr:FtsX-like permease family protein [Bifidobacterium gallicum]EFA23456.1 efflux ABC transporter, permease protein [Bifidobacterium gallicum DSM 20093 = LMG 11596]KFI57255.1 putative ABC transporter permease protein [Bifidobacterium gallicum DSM 20093 = LMG 11596]
MWRLTLTMMKKNLRMLIPAGIAVIISTMFITCSLIFGDAMTASIRDQVTAGFGNANWVVSPGQPDDSATTIHTQDDDVTDDGTQEPVDEWEPTVGSFQVEQARRIIDSTTKADSTAKLVGTRADVQISARLVVGDDNTNGLAIAPGSDTALLPLTISKGHQPSGANEVAIPEKLAQRLGLNLGDTVTLVHTSPMPDEHNQMREYRCTPTIVGFTTDPSGTFSYYGGAMVLSEHDIATLLGKASFNDVPCYRMLFTMTGSAAVQSAAVQRLNHEMTVQVDSREVIAQTAIKAMTGDSGITKTFLLCFGGLALIVAALVIANTFQVLVAQRRRTLALLRIIGARQGQVYRSVVLESVLLGLVSSALGVGAGIGVMQMVANSHVLESMVPLHVVLTVWTFVVPIVFGTIATMLASLGAARMAMRVTPLEAMRPVEISEQAQTRRLRGVLGLLMILVGIGCCMLGVWKADDDRALFAAMLGCAMTFVGIAVTARFWLPWLMKGLGTLASHCGPSATLASANIAKNPRRVAATGTALLIGVTLVATMGTGAACAKQTMNTALATRYSVDIVIADVPSDQAAALTARVSKHTGVRDVLNAPLVTTTVTGNVPDAMRQQGAGPDLTLLGVPNVEALSKVLNVDCSHLQWNDHTVIVPKYLPSTGKELNAGPQLTVTTDGDHKSSAAADVTLQTQTLDFRGVMPRSLAIGFVPDSLFDNGELQASSSTLLVAVDSHNDTSLANLMDALSKDIASVPQAQLTGPVAEKQQWDQMVDMMLMMLVVLLAVAVIIALIGVANTLSLSVIERTRESATLRAIGMTKRQLRRSLGIEACLITVVSSVVGLVLGTAFGALGTYMVMKSAIGDFSFAIDWRVDIAIIVIAILAALVASIGPARRANSVPPVEALAEA